MLLPPLFGGTMYEIITLPNGVRLACEHMDGVRSAAVGIWVGVGSRCEKRLLIFCYEKRWLPPFGSSQMVV